MKKTIQLVTFLSFLVYYPQIGIHTQNPQGVFNIDAKKNNPQTGVPTIAQQKDDFTINSNGDIGIGTNLPSNKLHIISDTNGAIKINDGTQGEGKIFISDANGVGTWQYTSPPVIINSNTGSSVMIGTELVYVGSSAKVTTPGYYLISPKFLTDHTPTGCSYFIAYNLSKDPTTKTSAAFPISDAHFSSGPTNDLIYSTNVGFLSEGTYYMMVRYFGNCTSNSTRTTHGENSFTLTLLK